LAGRRFVYAENLLGGMVNTQDAAPTPLTSTGGHPYRRLPITANERAQPLAAQMTEKELASLNSGGRDDATDSRSDPG
jgi:hypothetical protein